MIAATPIAANMAIGSELHSIATRSLDAPANSKEPLPQYHERRQHENQHVVQRIKIKTANEHDARRDKQSGSGKAPLRRS